MQSCSYDQDEKADEIHSASSRAIIFSDITDKNHNPSLCNNNVINLPSIHSICFNNWGRGLDFCCLMQAVLSLGTNRFLFRRPFFTQRAVYCHNKKILCREIEDKVGSGQRCRAMSMRKMFVNCLTIKSIVSNLLKHFQFLRYNPLQWEDFARNL